MTELRERMGQAIETVELRPPSVWAETVDVLRTAALIAFAVWMRVGWVAAPAATAASAAPAGEIAFADLGPDDQRLCRELSEGLVEAENSWARTRRWPEPNALADQGIPPFGGDVMAMRAGYAWTLKVDGRQVEYLGTPALTGHSAFLLTIAEPDPGLPPETTPPDETHHRLTDGTLLHVAVWRHPDGPARAGRFSVWPALDGWARVTTGPAPVR